MTEVNGFYSMAQTYWMSEPGKFSMHTDDCKLTPLQDLYSVNSVFVMNRHERNKEKK